MGCWVAPSIAADYWGMSLADVIALMSGGSLQTQHSGGFSFIRLPMFSRPGQAIPSVQRPTTFNLIAPEDSPTQPNSRPVTDDAFGDDDESELGPPPEEDPNDNRIADWRQGRRAASTRRKPPSSQANGDC